MIESGPDDLHGMGTMFIMSHMKYQGGPLILAASGVLLVIAVILVIGFAIPRSLVGSIYSIEQVEEGLRIHPTEWSGRVVLIRGVLVTWQISNTSQIRLLANEGWSPRERIFQVNRQGRYQLNVAGTTPTLVVQGLTKAVPVPSLPAFVYDLGRDLSRVPLIGRLVALPPVSPVQAHVYRVRLLQRGLCPSVVIGPCPTGVMIP
jgi:hypothetical protein